MKLGTHTAGDYVESVIAGAGLQGSASGEGSVATLAVGAGNGITVGGDTVGVNLQQGGGLSFSGGALGLLASCSDWQVLKWNAVDAQWECGIDSVGAGGSFGVKETDGSPTITSVSEIEFGPIASSSDEFVVINQGAGTVRIRSGTAIPLTNAAATISGAWTFSSSIVANGGISCADCVALGSETTGAYTAGLLAGTGLSVSGSGGEGAVPTVSLDSGLAIFQTIDASLGTDPVADSLSDTLSLKSGDGVKVTGDATLDSITFDLSLASGSGLAVTSGALSLLNTCADSQFLAWSTAGSSWGCTTLATAPSLFKSISGDSGTATADNTTDSIAFIGGNGLTTTAADAPDTVTLNIDLAAGSGLGFSGGALSLMSCSDGQILKRVAGAWACGADNNTLATAFQQHIAGTNDITYGSVYVPLLRDGLGAAASLPITVQLGNAVDFTATIESNSSFSAGAVSYVVVRDDNFDNDCVTTAGDGTKVGGWMSNNLGSVGQEYTTSFTFTDPSPGVTNPHYQLCASTTIATGTVKATDRSLRLQERQL